MSTITLSRAERLLIQRRRLGETQVEAARRYGVNLSKYLNWETRGKTVGCPILPAPVLTDAEICMIHRTRAGKTQAQVAEEIGRCRFWVNMAELGLNDCTQLLEHWERT